MKKMTFIKCASLSIFLLLTLGILLLFDSYTHSEMEPLYLKPTLHDANGWKLYTTENNTYTALTPEEVLALSPSQAYCLSRTLTREQEESGYTCLQISDSYPCAIFLDDALLYTNCPGRVFSATDVSFSSDYEEFSRRGEWIRCSLPSHFAGHELTIVTTVGDSAYGPSIPGIVLTSEAIASEMTSVSVSRELIPAVGFSAAALLLLAFWLFGLFQGVYHYRMLLPILAALLQALTHLRQLDFVSVAFTTLNTPLAQFIPMLTLLLPLLYFLLQMNTKRNRTVFGCILGFSAIIAGIAPAAAIWGGLPFYSDILVSNEIFYLPVAALLVLSVLEARQGNTHLRLFLSGLGLILLCGILVYAGSLMQSRYLFHYISTVFRSAAARSPQLLWNGCGVMFFLLAALVSLYKNILHTIELHSDLALQTERSAQLDRQLSTQKDFYDARLSHEKELRALRHDMDGHLSTLAALLSDHKTDEARSYLHGITKQHHSQNTRVFANNPYIHAVLQNYEAKCHEKQIRFIYHIGNCDCELPATELCLILNNALENAVEAVCALPEESREIKLQATVNRQQFLLRISNPFQGSLETIQDLPATTKSGKEHGYGLSNIRQAAERLDGSMECYVKNGYFVLDVDFMVQG